MKNPNPNFTIFEILEHKKNEIIDKINEMHDIIGADPPDSQLRILEWIFYQVCSNEIADIRRFANVNRYHEEKSGKGKSGKE